MVVGAPIRGAGAIEGCDAFEPWRRKRLRGIRRSEAVDESSIGGTSTTMKIVGRIRNTSGISSLTGVFCARSSAI